MTDETYAQAFDPITLLGSTSFDPRRLPDDTFDSAEEREQVFRLITRYNQSGKFTPEMSDEFRAIANERIKRAPMRFFLWLPLRRITSIWLTGFATTNRFHRFLRILFVLPILVGGVLGFVIWTRNDLLGQLLVLLILTRSLFFAYYPDSEARYIVEAYPSMIAACGVTGAALWRYLNRVRTERRTR